MNDILKEETSTSLGSTRMRKKHPPTCPPMQHDLVAHQETVPPRWLTIAYTFRTLLYCRKCGFHFYVEKSPTDYYYQLTAGTNSIPFNNNGVMSITYGEENRCQ